MVLDIALFRKAKGGDPEVVRESQRRRYASVELVDKVIALDEAWVAKNYELNQLSKEANQLSKSFAAAKKAGDSTDEIAAKIAANKERSEALREEESRLLAERDAVLTTIGNLIPDWVRVSDNEDDNPTVYLNDRIIPVCDAPNGVTKALNHIALMERARMMDCPRGVKIAGNRGYFLTGYGALLNQALVHYGLQFLSKRGFQAMQTPFFMEHAAMSKCCQLEDFEEQLYKVTGEGSDKYLIATSEQPLCAFHMDEVIDFSKQGKRMPLAYHSIRTKQKETKELDCILYAGMSSCFRKEVGRHGHDTLGIFRIHQFEKVEQIVLCKAEDSWDMHEFMISNSCDFFDSLGIPYRVVVIVSGALNNAAAMKYDLEGYFPGSKTYRELVSCSNCTDYQSRSLNIRYQDGKDKKYVHLLNSTLSATERTLCCLVENHQRPDGISVPRPLQAFVGTDFLPFCM
ncbi:Seryl-tRNA synthetase [Giardia muris]|uniref:serine--tRNA ligase n=1 Tax=Giardia muris TaxID=5742 RepID=A0A4Z1T7W4_GIAMU|nr:Seryl-tRNA synthetase [Giardia muris]|eukprot:TNJ28581.1 Seryl-tRNA synthetase [Giardia muris]